MNTQDTIGEQPHFFAWIEDEEQLRDEAVLFGLSEGDLEKKIAVIDAYFEERRVRATWQQQNLLQKRERVSQELAEKRQELQTLQSQSEKYSEYQAPQNHYKARFLVGTLAYAAISVLGFSWVYTWLAPHWQSPLWITLGAYGLGLFSLWNTNSVFYDSNVAPTWRRWLEELGTAFIAAFFVVVWEWPKHGWLESLSVFLLTFFVFMYAGKGLLASLSRWAEAMNKEKTEQSSTQFREERLAEANQKIPIAKEQCHTLELELEQLHEAVAASTEPQLITARRNLAVKLFESEAQLARTTKAAIVMEQLPNFRSKFDFPQNRGA
jgi:hypothetical protein